MTTVNDFLDLVMDCIKDYWMWMIGIVAVLFFYGVLLTVKYFIKVIK